MAIAHTVRKAEEAPEGAVLTDISEKYRNKPEDTDFTLFAYKTHVGLCLYEEEENSYHDSDFYMVVWDWEANAPKRIYFASTRGWTYPEQDLTTVDATPEVRAAYEAWVKAEEERRSLLEAKIQAEREAAELKQPAKGRTIKVVRGRKVPVGTTGLCAWIGQGINGLRVRLVTADGQAFFTAASNVEAV